MAALAIIKERWIVRLGSRTTACFIARFVISMSAALLYSRLDGLPAFIDRLDHHRMDFNVRIDGKEPRFGNCRICDASCICQKEKRRR